MNNISCGQYAARVFYPVQTIHRDSRSRAKYNRLALGASHPHFIYRNFTGNGGLHGLRRSAFADFNAYTEAKRRFELGQFFTPDPICRTMVEMLEIEPGARVADICCGKGSFFNYLRGCELYGVEKDQDAYRVCSKLFPQARIQHADMRSMRRLPPCDYVVGNPPFIELDCPGNPLADRNGRISAITLYLQLAAYSLREGGHLAFICPNYREARLVNTRTEQFFARTFTTLAEIRLARGTFPGVNIPTKIIVARKTRGDVGTGIAPLILPYRSHDQVLASWKASAQYQAMEQCQAPSQ